MPLAPEREANNEPAYLLGRIFAEIQALEIAACGGNRTDAVWLNKMAAASANPVIVLSLYASHGKVWDRKLRNRDLGDVADSLKARISALAERIEPGVRPIGLDASSWWSLGYWHQKAANDRDAELVDA